MKGLMYLLVIVSLVWFGCDSRDIDIVGGNTKIEVEFPKSEIEFSIDETIPKIEILSKGKLLFSIDYAEGGGFFIQRDRTTREFLNKFESIRKEDGITTLYLSSENNRKGILKIENDSDRLSINFTLEKKSNSEQLGVILNTSKGEGYYGLIERVVQGDQSRSWEEGMKEGFNLRGQEVFLYIYPTLSIYSPFFVSSNKYGIYIKSNWHGRYLFGTERDDTIGIIYEGMELPMVIFSGKDLIEITEKYARSVGTTIMPPRFAFGHLRWRDEHYNLYCPSKNRESSTTMKN